METDPSAGPLAGERSEVVRRAKRTAWIDGDVCRIPLTGGHVAVVDAIDADLGRFNWCARARPHGVYAYRMTGPQGARVHLQLGRVVAERAGHVLDAEVDHIDRDPLNNRRGNLRPATRAQNSVNRGVQRNNTSGFTGAVWNARARRWNAVASAGGRQRYLGTFGTAAEAAAHRDEFIRRVHGAFAPSQRKEGRLA